MIDKPAGLSERTLPLEFDLNSYHCKSIRKMQLSRMDSSCCLGFLCKTSSDFENWCEIVRDLATPTGAKYPMFSIMEGRVSDHLLDSEKLFSQCMDSDVPDSAADMDKSEFWKNTSASSDSDADDFVFL